MKIIHVALKAFDEELSVGSSVLTDRARIALKVFKSTYSEATTQQQISDVSDMAERLRLADSIAPLHGYGVLARFYEGELKGMSNSKDVLEVLLDLKYGLIKWLLIKPFSFCVLECV